MIDRKRLYEKLPARRDAQKIYILCEGDTTEVDYFSFFTEMSSNLQLVVIPPIEHKSDPEKLKIAAEKYFLSEEKKYVLDAKEKDMVWFVIDTDQWKEHGKIEILRNFCDEQNAKYEKQAYQMFQITQSNPCFEIWLYYHFFSSVPQQREVDASASMKEFVNDKINGGFNMLYHPIFINEAIENSRTNYKEDCEKYPLIFSTQVFRLGEVILRYDGEELKKKKRTLQ